MDRAPITPFRILHIEDNDSDALDIVQRLAKPGVEADLQRYQPDRTNLAKTLQESWDVLLIADSTPDLNDTLAWLAIRYPDLPVILLVRARDEEEAATLLGRGAWDFVAKDRLARLLPVLDRVIKESRRCHVCQDVELQFRRFVRDSTEAMAMFNRSMVYLAASKRWSEDFGLDHATLVGQSHYAVFPDLPLHWKEVHQRVLAGESLEKEEDCFERADGREQWLRWKAVPWRDRQGQIRGLIISSEDITEQKLIESELRMESARFQTLLETSSDWIWEVDSGGHYTYASPQVKTLLGYEPNELLGHTPFDLMPRQEVSRLGGAFAKIVTAQQPFALLENINIRKDGQRVVLETSGTPIIDADGNLLGYRGVDRDVTQRVEAQQALRDSQDMLQRAQAVARIGSWALLNGSERLSLSKEAARIFDLPDIGTTTFSEIISCVHPDDKTKVESGWQAVLGGIPFYDLTVRLIVRNQLIWVRTLTEVETDPQGKMVRALGTVQDITAQKSLEQANAQLLQALDESADFVATADLMGRSIYINAGGRTLVGLAKEAPLNYLTTADFHPAWISEKLVKEIFPKVLAGERWRGELTLLGIDGREIPVDANIFPLTDEYGQITAFATVQSDLTEFKQREAILQTERQRLNNIIEGTQAGTWEWNVQTGEATFNSFWAEMIGYTLAELAPLNIDTWIKLAHPDDLKHSSQLLERHFSSADPYYECEARIKHKDGHWVWVLDRGRVLSWSEDGKPLLMSGIHLDISERKEAELHSKRLQSVIDDSLDFVGIADLQATVIYINKAGRRMVGLPEEGNLGSVSIKNFLTETAWEQTLSQVIPALRLTGYWQGDSALRHRDGHSIPVSRHARMHFDTNGKPIYMSAVLRDIRERVTLEQELMRAKEAAEAANIAKSQFLSTMSHEIRTPLTAILGFSEVLLETDASEEQRETALQAVLDNGRHLHALINDLLDMSKIEAGRLEFETLPLNLADLLESSLSSLRGLFQEKKLNFFIHYLPPLPARIHSDPTRLRQIIINLLGNAIKFTDRGSVRVLVSCDVSEQLLLISILDSGIGMDAQQQERLFQPFVQGDNSITRRHGGTGLGLALSRQLARGLGGDLQVDSSEGAGSLFTVHIPTGPLDPNELVTDLGVWNTNPIITPRPSIPTPPRLTGRVLLAEDNPYNQQLLGQRLTRLGLEVVIVGDGEVAVAKAMEEDFDLILMDMQMPIMDGLEATRLLRQALCPTPIVALTAHSLKSYLDQTKAAGCDDFLTKPVDWSAFYRVLMTYLPAAEERESAPQSQPTEDKSLEVLAERFHHSLPDTVKEMRQALEAGELERIAGLAHQLKGVAGGLGYPALGETARILEAAAHNEARAAVENILEELYRSVDNSKTNNS